VKIDDTKNIILFYDGDCGFCNSSVQFVLKHRRHSQIYFATLQSDFAKDLLKTRGIDIKLDTLYLLKNNTIYDKSSGALQLTSELKSPFPILKVFYIIPKFIRDTFYTYIAERRHKIQHGSCVLPTDEEKELFLY